MADVVRRARQLWQRVSRHEGINEVLGAVVGLVFGQCKGRDVLAIGRHLAHMTLTVELESSDAQSFLLK